MASVIAVYFCEVVSITNGSPIEVAHTFCRKKFDILSQNGYFQLEMVSLFQDRGPHLQQTMTWIGGHYKRSLELFWLEYGKFSKMLKKFKS